MGSPLKLSPRTRGTEQHPSLSELVQLPPIREALQWFSRERQWITEQQLQLCRIPAPTFLGGRRIIKKKTQLRSLSWDARIDRGGNVIAWPEATRGQFVALTAHLDTVLAPRVAEDIR